MDRDARAKALIATAGYGDAVRSNVAGDASNRRYDRLRKANGESVILMDAPPNKGEDVVPFVKIATFLTNAGLSAPQILAQDEEAGFLIIEDLGDDLFARVLEADAAPEMRLYSAAIDVLCHLHTVPPPQLDRYDAIAMVPMGLLAFDWYQHAATGRVSGRDAAKDALHKMLDPLACCVLIQRDYHAENLLWLPDRKGVAQVGLLDFQDAMIGHPAYDLCSVLLDARRDVPEAVQQAMLDRYCTQANVQDRATFEAAYWALALQRNLRILGVFTRLCVRDGKKHYVDLIPRVWGHVMRAIEAPSLAAYRSTLVGALPPPTPDILQKLKDQCATYQTPS